MSAMENKPIRATCPATRPGQLPARSFLTDVKLAVVTVESHCLMTQVLPDKNGFSIPIERKCSIGQHFNKVHIQGSAKRSADFVKQQSGRASQ